MHVTASDVWPLLAELSPPLAYPRGSELTLRDQCSGWVYFLEFGRIRVLTSLPGELEVRVADLGPGAAIGVAAAIANRPDRTTAVVLEPSELRSIAASRFRILIETNPDATRWAARTLALEARRQLMALAQLRVGAEVRLQLHFAELLAECGVRLSDGSVRLAVAPSQAELAQVIGVSREYAGRLLARSEADGVIRRHKGWYIVPAGSPVFSYSEDRH